MIECHWIQVVHSSNLRKPHELGLVGFSIPFWQGGLVPRLATVCYLCPTICRYSTKRYLLRRTARKMESQTKRFTSFPMEGRGRRQLQNNIKFDRTQAKRQCAIETGTAFLRKNRCYKNQTRSATSWKPALVSS